MRLFSIFISSFLCGQCYFKGSSVNFDEYSEDIDISSTFTEDYVGDPLFLTPLLKNGEVNKARTLAKVEPSLKGFQSYAGYLTVNETCDSNLFFWFFPSERKPINGAVILWIQVGPGRSSLFSLLNEVGPIDLKNNLVKRMHRWNRKNHLLFIDQPVGTGYSFTGKGCYATDIVQIQEEIYSAILQFYQIFPNLIKNNLFLAGQSYGGHSIPAIGYFIHQRNPSAEFKINLSGMMIGNGFMDNTYQTNYGDYLYQLGLIDNYQLHAHSWDLLSASFTEIVGNISKYNYLKPQIKEDEEPWVTYIQTSDVRRALHVGNQSFSVVNDIVFTGLTKDWTVSVKQMVEELLEHYPIVFYYGQLDIICPYPMAVRFLKALSWSGEEDYKNAKRQQWCVEGELAGYFKSGHNLHEVMIRNAGHLVPEEQPRWACALVSSVTSGLPENPLHGLNKCSGQ